MSLVERDQLAIAIGPDAHGAIHSYMVADWDEHALPVVESVIDVELRVR